MPVVWAESCYEKYLMKDLLESLLERVLTWPKAARDKLVRAVHDIEAQDGGISSRCGDRRGAMKQRPTAPGQDGLAADAETEGFFKRHPFNFL